MRVMKHVADLLADLDLPAATGGDAPAGGAGANGGTDEGGASAPPALPGLGLGGGALLHDLGADLPSGHLHLWAGPRGVGKTAFLLALMGGAAAGGRRVVYATYHLPGQTLALRLLAMLAGVDATTLAEGRLTPEQAHAAAAAREMLARQALWILEARGMTATSLEDRLVRMPFRAQVLAVDYLQAVVRPEGQDLGTLLRFLSDLASRLHVAVVGSLEANEAPRDVGQFADRAGWIALAGTPGDRRAEIIENRYGARPAMGLHLDETSGVLRRVRGFE